MPDALRRVLSPMRETIEVITGRRPGIARIEKLKAGASVDEVAAKVNELIDLLQNIR